MHSHISKHFQNNIPQQKINKKRNVQTVNILSSTVNTSKDSRESVEICAQEIRLKI